jgi:two-component system nitrate/nitrite response regulator NarL
MQSRIRILIIDDHALWRESLFQVLSEAQDVEVVGSCGSIAEAVGVLREASPDLVLLDDDVTRDPDADFLPKAREAGFRGRVMLVTATVTECEARRLLADGVGGIIYKTNSVASLLDGIRAVSGGGAWWGRE